MFTFSFSFYLLCILMTQQNLCAGNQNGCQYGTEQGVSFADCRKLFLTEFPENLKGKIEGLYLSWNFIGFLRNDTFKNHSSIKYLYLERNSALELESHTFAPLTKLYTLDLSYIPKLNITNLYFPPSLKKLYLSGIKTISAELPFASLRELSYLTLSECMLSHVPSFSGNLPSLEVLNLTANTLENLKIDNFAFLCQLKKLYISDNVSVKNNCECLRLKKWMEEQSITGSRLFCRSSETEEKCDSSPSAVFLKEYETCKTDVMKQKLLYWFLVGCAVFVFCFSLIILYVCCNRKGLFCSVLCCYCKKKSEQKF